MLGNVVPVSDVAELDWMVTFFVVACVIVGVIINKLIKKEGWK